MRSVAIVVGEEARQGCDPFGGRVVGPLVGPAVLHDLHERLRLPVRLRPVGPRAPVDQALFFAGRREGARAVAAAVVRKQALHLDAVALEEAQSPLQEAGGALAAFVGELLGVGQPGGVVDGHVSVVPADAAVAILRPAEALATAPPDAPEALGIEVQKVAGVRPAVAQRGLARLKRAQAVQPMAPEGTVDGRRGEVRLPGDPSRTAALPETQQHDAAQEFADHAQGDAQRA
jgi:hypothetical protein